MGANRPKVGGFPGRYTPEAAARLWSGAEDPAGSRSHNLLLRRRASLMQEPVLVLNATYEPITSRRCDGPWC